MTRVDAAERLFYRVGDQMTATWSGAEVEELAKAQVIVLKHLK